MAGMVQVSANMAPLVAAKNVGVRYVAGRRREDLQSLIYHLLVGRSLKGRDFWALRGLGFTGYSGEIIGIIGGNGAGKTTLCRLISGLLRPDLGRIEVGGRVLALLSMGSGFNPLLSGAENILLNGMMLGLSRAEIEKLLPEIVAFSGLEKSIQRPLRHYSNGMKARLGFSIAITVKPEILVLDETLSVGDLAFTRKAAAAMRELVRTARLVLVVTHHEAFVLEHCTRALWLEQGVLRADGAPAEVVAAYRSSRPPPRRLPAAPAILRNDPVPRSGSRPGGAVPVISAVGAGVCFKVRRGGKAIPFRALRELDFQINAGEIVGIIGANGAGKTTLTRLLCGILRPDRGRIEVAGEVSALLTFGAGFNPQLSGRDNIRLNGMMLGISRRQLIGLEPAIGDFSGLGEALDQPVKHYSRGMRARLGFSIAAEIEPDIFIIDEALSVGDAAFRQKAESRIRELIGRAKAVLVVTHSLAFVEKVCTRALWLEQGAIRSDGNPHRVVEQYRRFAAAPAASPGAGP